MGPQARGRFGEGAHALAAHRRLQRSSLEGQQVALDRLLVAADLAINHGELFLTLGVLVGSSPPRLDRFGEQIVLLGGGLACAPRTVLLAGVGVTPQDCGALGKVANCQVGVSVHAATDQASCPIDWRLFLPPEWDHDTQRRRKAHLPDDVHHRPKWQLALDMVDELAGWELAPPVILADAADGEVNQFRLGLEQRALAYVVQVPGTISAYPQQVVPETVPDTGRGQPSKPRYRQPRSSLRQLVLAAGEQAARTLAWRQGADGEQLVSAVLHLVSTRRAEGATLIRYQITKASSSNATASRKVIGFSTASS